MPAPLLTKDEVLDRLLAAFRDRGYEGASLAELGAATGLGKSSLYHHFPGGKAEMAEQVLAHLDRQLGADVYTPLRTAASPTAKLDMLLAALDAFYESGRRACLLERLCASIDRPRFRQPLRHAFDAWMHAVEVLAREAGLPSDVARARAEAFVVQIEGALVVCAGTEDVSIFGRTIDRLRATTLAA